jgi:hypothetical protein
MKFKAGDKVKFLNENGGGKVLAVIDTRMVRVELDNGFEVPVLASDLILDYRSAGQEEKPRSEANLFPSQAVEKEEKSAISPISSWGNIKEEKGIYLAYLPHDQQWVLTGDLDVVLVNNTAYEMLYSFFLEQKGQIKGIDFSSVPAESRIVIETINRDEIEDWIKGYVQVLLHHDTPEKVFLPVHSVIDISPNRFFKDGSYRSNTLVSGKAILFTIGLLTSFESASFSETVRKSGQSAIASVAEQNKEKPIIDKHRTVLGEAIIDLHIGELMDNIAGLTSHDMFSIQMNYFRKTLESAIKNEYQKVTYIHGIGNGVLKNAIIKEIEEYEGIDNQMASISKFGVGAIDILIKMKK